ncbi:hypothetical protein PoB_006562800 [Plakobranchus ocellatus]|uniref:Uncharacterized protein n=1 Tax=Plakobranchus ocellatus TaxID=259542 RepID=A0AAV4D4R1_9GAST|nr:hypothetical protein PoB_006562800 [Plakobranchus ocellatus]
MITLSSCQSHVNSDRRAKDSRAHFQYQYDPARSQRRLILVRVPDLSIDRLQLGVDISLVQSSTSGSSTGSTDRGGYGINILRPDSSTSQVCEGKLQPQPQNPSTLSEVRAVLHRWAVELWNAAQCPADETFTKF